MNKFQKWGYALLQTVIGGAATAASSWLGLTAAKAVGLEVPTLNFQALGMILLSGAVTNLFFFLKASPLPKMDDTNPPFPGPQDQFKGTTTTTTPPK